VHGIPSLPPGGKRVVTWGQYGGLFNALGGSSKDIVIRFRSKRRLFGGSKTHENTCSIDIRSFEATDASDRNWNKQVAENVDKLRQAIESESRNWMRKLDDMQSSSLPEQAGGPSDDSGQEPESSERAKDE